ncbi:hypothetical protein [Tumebacillus algifaecis]|uniref:hypothetical protein n=1 Tax=Tumebacillus algifaecis TaxID=1214604 RepID=UPI0012FE5FF7|nr:hypothetical protein [Tumebacillus algifaecis]
MTVLYAGVLAVPAYSPRQNGNSVRLRSVVKDAEARSVHTTSGIAAIVERQFSDVICSGFHMALLSPISFLQQPLRW